MREEACDERLMMESVVRPLAVDQSPVADGRMYYICSVGSCSMIGVYFC